MYVVLYQKLISHKWVPKFNHISFKRWKVDDDTKFWQNWQISWSNLINAHNILLIIKLELRRAPGTDGSGYYRNHISLAI